MLETSKELKILLSKHLGSLILKYRKNKKVANHKHSLI